MDCSKVTQLGREETRTSIQGWSVLTDALSCTLDEKVTQPL